MTYFQVASSAVRVWRCPTRNAVTTVVASIATQITPMLLAQHGEHHGGQERRDQRAVQPGPTDVGVAVREFGVDVADARPGGERADDADDDAAW